MQRQKILRKDASGPTRFLVPPNSAADGLVVDETLLAELRRRLPRRLPRGWKLRSLECPGLNLAEGLPPGQRCEDFNRQGQASDHYRPT
jgi:hypothetical protein